MPVKLTHPRQILPNLQNLNNPLNLPNLRSPVLAGGHSRSRSPEKHSFRQAEFLFGKFCRFYPPTARS